MLHLTLRRAYHSALRPPPISVEERVQTAKNALLAFNVMIAQSIQPDVFMYTHLIRIMGDAGYEWQAYKFFARMLEQGVTPLPETYAALKAATHKRRTSLHEDIQKKLEEVWQKMPDDIAAELDRMEESQRLTLASDVAKMHDGKLIPAHILESSERFNGNMEALPASALLDRKPQASPSEHSEDSSVSTEVAGTQRNSSYASLKIDSPALTWETFKAAQEASKNEAKRMKPDEREKALEGLQILHDDELRIFLTIHRQLRHGERTELIDRIIDNVPFADVMAMLSRRVDFFVHMRREFKRVLDLEKGDNASLQAIDDAVRPIPNMTRDTSFENIESSLSAVEEQLAMRQTENHGKSTRVMYTPWGFIKEPIFKEPKRGIINPERTLALSEEEEKSIVAAANASELDTVPPRLLRQFARQYGLKWNRKGNGLYENIRFYVMHCMNGKKEESSESKDKEVGTAPVQREQTNSAKPSPMEMLQVIARYGAEVKAVDDDNLNAHIKTLMDRQRRMKIRNELQRSKEKSRSEIPELIRHRMKRAGVEPFDEIVEDTISEDKAFDTNEPWAVETAEDDISMPKTILQTASARGKHAPKRETYEHTGVAYEEANFGHFRVKQPEHTGCNAQVVARLQAERDSLLEKKARRPLNRTDGRRLSRCKKHLFRKQAQLNRAKYRKENPPNITKERKRMQNRL